MTGMFDERFTAMIPSCYPVWARTMKDLVSLGIFWLVFWGQRGAHWVIDVAHRPSVYKWSELTWQTIQGRFKATMTSCYSVWACMKENLVNLGVFLPVFRASGGPSRVKDVAYGPPRYSWSKLTWQRHSIADLRPWCPLAIDAIQVCCGSTIRLW